MTLRRSTPADVAAVTALETELFGADAWSRSSVAAELTAPDRWCAVVVEPVRGPAGGVEVVGYVVTMRGGEVCDLQRIGVRPGAQRRGVGRALLAAASRQAVGDGAQRMLLEVAESNAAARAVYASAGFVEIDRRAGYYRDGADALVLCRDLAGQRGAGTTGPE